MTMNKKLVSQQYESFFSKEQSDLLSSQPDFWDSFFLLSPNCASLQSYVKECVKKNRRVESIRLLMSQCIVALKEDSNVKIANSLLTMCVVCKSVCVRKKKQTYDNVDIIMGQQDIDVKMEVLRIRLCELLLAEWVPNGSKSLVLEFLLVLVTAKVNLSENTFLQYLMSDQLFDAFVGASLTLNSRHVLGFKALLLLTLLVNFKDQNVVNPFIVKLSLIHDEVVLNAFAHVICSEFCDFNRKYEARNEPHKSSGLFSSLTNMVGNMFIADDDSNNRTVTVRTPPLKPSNSLLLALFHAIRLNRNFIILLTNFAAEPLDDSFQFNNHNTTGKSFDAVSISSETGPSNLLVSFLEFCSIVMLNTKDESSCKTSRLCFVILTCISEDQGANSIMHDSNIAFKVTLHRMPMRHRKMSIDSSKPLKPLAHTLLDLMAEFIVSNLRKSLPLDLHSFALGIIHRLICYQKKYGIRFNYPWTDVWSAMFSLLKYLVNHESDLPKSNANNPDPDKNNILTIIQEAINIFNLFIVNGDMFLASGQDYDQLYYEIIRMHIVFDNLYLMCTRFAAIENSPFKQQSNDVVTSMTNIRSIINHLNPKIDVWKAQKEIETLTEENVLEVVKKSYDTLNVMLMGGLDVYDSYDCESLTEKRFFQQMLEQVISEYRESGFKDQEIGTRHSALVKEISDRESEQAVQSSSVRSDHHLPVC